MSTQLSPTYLGKSVLVVVDPVNGFLDEFRSIVSLLSEITYKSFTLLRCCPTHYWEHSGSDNPDAQQQIEAITTKEQDGLNDARNCLNQAKAILQDAGVLDSRIHIRVSTDDNLVAATMKELKLRHYSGVIVSSYHYDVVARLQRQGITDMFRKIPKVQVHTLKLKSEEIAEVNM